MYGKIPSRGDLLHHQLQVSIHKPIPKTITSPANCLSAGPREESTSTRATLRSPKPINLPTLVPSRREASILYGAPFHTPWPPFQAQVMLTMLTSSHGTGKKLEM